MSALGRIRKMLRGSAVVTPRAKPAPYAGFVYVVEAEGLVGVGHATEISDALAYVAAALPSAKPAYIWATDTAGLEKRVCDLARFALESKATENGWFRCPVDDARQAIRAAASTCGVPDVIKFDMPEGAHS